MIKYALFLSQMKIKSPKYTFKIFLLTDPVTCMLPVTEISVDKQTIFFFIRFLLLDKTENWHTFEPPPGYR